GWPAAFTGEYEEAHLALLLRFFEPRTFVIDAGANFGFFTVPLAVAARRVLGRVVAFEPIPTNVSVLRRNLVENAVDHLVALCPIGLGDRPCEVPFEVEPGGFGDAHVMLGALAPRLAVQPVPLRLERLDD